MPAYNPANPEPTSERRMLRRRAADRTAARLHLAMSDGLSNKQMATELACHTVDLDTFAVFGRILRDAAGVAAVGDTAALTGSCIPRGHLCVIRLHGPDWSLILSHGRPLPGLMLAVEDCSPRDEGGLPVVWRLRINSDEDRVAAMNLAILAAVAPTAS